MAASLGASHVLVMQLYYERLHCQKQTLPILSRLLSSVTFPPKADNAENKRSSTLPCRSILKRKIKEHDCHV